MICFTADQHFGCANIIKRCIRPFETVSEIASSLIVCYTEMKSKCDARRGCIYGNAGYSANRPRKAI